MQAQIERNEMRHAGANRKIEMRYAGVNRKE
jgi:hypothetical protein